MPITKVADRANVNGNAAVTTVDLVLASLTVDNYLIIRTAADNSGGGGAARSCTPSNQSGTPVDIAGAANLQANYDPGAASAGTTVNVIIAKITATSGTVRLTYSGSVVQAAQAEEWSGIHASAPVVQSVSGTGLSNNSAVNLTLTGVVAGNLFYGAQALEGPGSDTWTNDTDTTNGSWVDLTRRGTSNGTADANQTVTGGYKVVTATGNQSWFPTTGTTRDCAAYAVELAAIPTTTPVGDTLEARWDVRSAVGDTLEARWDVRAPIGDTLDTRWDVRSAVGDTTDLRWDVEVPVTAVGKDLAVRWDVRNALGDTVQPVWNTRAAVGDQVQARWDVRASQGDTLQTVWGTRRAIGDQLDTRWAVRQTLADTVDARWATRAVVNDSIDLRWDVLAAVSAVGDTLTLTWDVRSPVGDELDSRWAVHALTLDQLDARWSVLAGSAPTEDLVVATSHALDGRSGFTRTSTTSHAIDNRTRN